MPLVVGLLSIMVYTSFLLSYLLLSHIGDFGNSSGAFDDLNSLALLNSLGLILLVVWGKGDHRMHARNKPARSGLSAAQRDH